MDYKEVRQNNYIEKYLMGELDDDIKLRFEEHLLFCEETREEFERSERVIAGLKHIAQKREKETEDESSRNEKKIRKIPYYYQISAAASIVLAVSLSVFVYNYFLVDIDDGATALLSDSLQTERQARIAMEDSLFFAVNKKDIYLKERDSVLREFSALMARTEAMEIVFRQINSNRYFDAPRNFRNGDAIRFELIEPCDFISMIGVGQELYLKWKTAEKHLSLLITKSDGYEALPSIKLSGSSHKLDVSEFGAGIYRYELNTDKVLGYGYFVIE